jgi:hypothetical protein
MPGFGITPIGAPVHGSAEIETTLAACGETRGFALIVMSDALLFLRRATIAALAEQRSISGI